MIQILTFRLVPGIDEEEFLVADRRVQTRFAYRQPGLLRRTTARGDDGNWVVIDLWRSGEEADACERRWDTDADAAAFMSFLDPASVRSERFATLD